MYWVWFLVEEMKKSWSVRRAELVVWDDKSRKPA